jgi:hypothetical protein
MRPTKGQRPVSRQTVQHTMTLSIPQVLTLAANIAAIEANQLHQLCECWIHMRKVRIPRPGSGVGKQCCNINPFCHCFAD